jgi:LysM repeat protein
VVEKIVEKPVETIVEKPVVVEKIVEVEKPATVEKAAETPVVAETAPEKPATEEKPAVSGKEYTLEVGDSLALLGRLNKVPPEAIVAANPGLLPTQMRVGQVIIIPSPESANAAKSAAPTKKQVPMLTSK